VGLLALLTGLALWALPWDGAGENGDRTGAVLPSPGVDAPTDGDATVPTGDRREVTFETGDLSEFDGISQLQGKVEVAADPVHDGRAAGRFVFAGSASHGYARGQLDVDWQPGDEVTYGMELYLPPGFLAAQTGSIDLLRWDNWRLDPITTDHGGLSLGQDGTLRLMRQQVRVGGYDLLLGPVEVDEGRWLRLKVRQVLSDREGEAVSEVWLDGRHLGRTTAANAFGRPITALRVGIVATGAGSQRDGLHLHADRIHYRVSGPARAAR
jgi:hypothetical protein